MIYKNTHKKGFTLIELLVVVSIVSLLSTVIMTNVNTARAKARDATRLQNVHQLKNALELYYTANGSYPAVGGAGGDGNVFSTGNLNDPLGGYIRNIPPDPSGATYLYQYVRNPPIYGYGILLYLEKNSTYCKTGVNMDPAWWNSAPNCGF